jgi:hypothetical protein
MKKKYFILMFFCFAIGFSNTDKYRIILIDNPSSSITISWNQISGTGQTVYYGTTDFGTNWASYPNSKTPDRATTFRGMNNQFARITGLAANTAYYFVIRDSQGTSQRFWFKTAPNDLSRLSFIAGGDSRNNRTPRQNANRLVAKLKPNAVFFGGDMTDADSDAQWQEWFDDWQLTTASDGRMFPIVPTRGNHEGASTIYNLFDTPTTDSYYAMTFGNNLFRLYTLNSEISTTGNQSTWLSNDIAANNNVIWKSAQYHKPMRPHNAAKSEGTAVYNAWANIFYNNEVRLVIDSDSHCVKQTWPVKPSTEPGSSEGFIRDDNNGTVYLGEGCWGAPLRSADDNKPWTRNSGSFNQFNLIWVDQNKIEARAINVDNASTVGENTNDNPFNLPTNLNVWNPSNGNVVEIFKNSIQPSPEISLSNVANGQCFDNGNDIELTTDILNNGGGILNVNFFVNGVFIGTDATFPYTFTNDYLAGIHTVLAVATDANGRTSSIEKYIFVGAFSETVTFNILTGDDDVEEAQDGRLYTDSSDLEMVYDSFNNLFYQTIGLRFGNIKIPKGATITNAYLQFTCDEVNTAATSLSIAIEDTNDASEYVEAVSYGVSSRTYLPQTVAWAPTAWSTVDQSNTNQRTPDIATLIQNIVAKPDWQTGNSLGIKITGTGTSLTNTAAKRVADAFEGGTTKAPKLVVSYTYDCNAVLSTPAFLLGNEILIYNQSNGIEIKSEKEFSKVEIYDITGKRIYSNSNINNTTFRIEAIEKRNQLLLIKVYELNGKTTTKKLIF